jgi:hypothetical protein
LDARELAKLLWTGELEAVWMAPLSTFGKSCGIRDRRK